MVHHQFSKNGRLNKPLWMKTVSGEIQNGCLPHPPYSPDLAPCDFFLFPKNEIEVERTPVWYQWGDPGGIADSAWHSDRKVLPASVPKKKKAVWPVSTCGKELLREMVADRSYGEFYDFYSVSRNILDTSSYMTE
jgi:hypothetical protein